MSTVLIVDDDVSTRVVLRLILERAGHEVVEAAHGEAALQMIGPSSLPDVVTTDLSMPIVGGKELIERLRSEPRTAAIPIVVVSGNRDAAWVLKASGLVEAVVSKPFAAEELTDSVRAVASNPLRSALTA